LGTYYIWDSVYCEQENRIKFDSFIESGDWEILCSWPESIAGEDGGNSYRVVVFKKVKMLATQDKEYQELGEADKYNSIYK
jgi:hypothetical protein